MNRIAYLLKAKTQYNIHSPFVFELYNNVLATKLDSRTQTQLSPIPYPEYNHLVYKLAHYYHLTSQTANASQTLLQGDTMRMMVVAKPHKNADAEKQWASTKSEWPVSIDLFDTGLLIDNGKLHPQHFLLRTWRLF